MIINAIVLGAIDPGFNPHSRWKKILSDHSWLVRMMLNAACSIFQIVIVTRGPQCRLSFPLPWPLLKGQFSLVILPAKLLVHSNNGQIHPRQKEKWGFLHINLQRWINHLRPMPSVLALNGRLKIKAECFWGIEGRILIGLTAVMTSCDILDGKRLGLTKNVHLP